MSRLLTFGSIASAVTFLAAGFAVGLVMGNREKFRDGLEQGRAELAQAEAALSLYADVVSMPSAVDGFTAQTRDALAALTRAVRARDYDEVDRLLPFDLVQDEKSGCAPNNEMFTVTEGDAVKVNCETGEAAVFVLHNANRVDATMAGTLRSLAPSGPSRWEFAEGGSCSLALVGYSDTDAKQAQLIFQNCGD